MQEKKGKFALYQKDTENAKSKAKKMFTGTYYECLAKFHSLCSFSYFWHKKFSFTHYDIKPVKK